MKRVLGTLLAVALLALFGAQGFAVGGAEEALRLEKSGGWQQAELRWYAAGGKAEFFDGLTRGEVEYAWKLRQVMPDGSFSEIPLKGRPGVSAVELPREGALVLTLQAAAGAFSGEYRVTLMVDGQESAPVAVFLQDDAALQAALAKAKHLAINPNGRYSEGYVARLQAAVAVGESLYASSSAAPEEVDARTGELLRLTANPELALTQSDFINKLIPSGWKIFDFIAAPFRWAQTRWSEVFSMMQLAFYALFQP